MAHGHFSADVDPLNLRQNIQNIGETQYGLSTKEQRNLIDPAYYGFTEEDMDKTFYVDIPELGGILQMKKQWKLREIIEAL